MTTRRGASQPPAHATHPEHAPNAKDGQSDDGQGDDPGEGSRDGTGALVDEDALGYVSCQPKRVDQ